MFSEAERNELSSLCGQLKTALEKLKRQKKIKLEPSAYRACIPIDFQILESYFYITPTGRSKIGMRSRQKRFPTEEDALTYWHNGIRAIHNDAKKRYEKTVFSLIENACENDLTEKYGDMISKQPMIVSALKDLRWHCSTDSCLQGLGNQLNSLVLGANGTLANRFQKKIWDNKDFYVWSTPLEEYTDMIEIGKVSHWEKYPLCEPSASAEDVDYPYRITNLNKILAEMQMFLDRRANAYARAAYRLYLKYCAEIEKVVLDIEEESGCR